MRTGPDDHGHPLGVGLQRQCQFQRAGDVEIEGDAGHGRRQFVCAHDAAIRVAENDRHTRKQLLSVFQQKQECRRVGRDDQLRPVVAILQGITAAQLSDVVCIVNARQIRRFDIDLDLHVRRRGKSPQDPVVPVRVRGQAASVRMQQEHPVGLAAILGRQRGGHEQENAECSDPHRAHLAPGVQTRHRR
jgi:hypothetical protein